MSVPEPRLQYILNFVDSHVRFGEAKNAALVAASGAIAMAIITIFVGTAAIPLPALVYLVFVLGGAGVSLVIGMISFLPQTSLPWLSKLDEPQESDSVLFFGHIQKYSAEDYWKKLDDSPGSPMTSAEFNYCEQIIINSRLASRKFTLFKQAVWALLFGLCTPFGGYLLFRYVKGPDFRWS